MWEKGKLINVHTTKRRVNENEEIETERQVSNALSESLLTQADPYRHTIHKRRMTFIYEGQYFEEFLDVPAHYDDRIGTHVINPFEIPAHWKIYRSFDWGYHRPFSCGWWAVDFDGCVYRILELYGCTENPDEGVRWTPEKQFAKIREVEQTHPWLKGRSIDGVADPAIWDMSRGESIYETALRQRIYFTKGDNRRIPGWMQLHYRMAFDREGYPQLYVFKGCRAFIRTIPELRFSDTDPEDLDTRQEDHVADESRYFCMSRPIKPRMAPTPDEYATNPMNLFLDIPKADVMSATKRPRMEIIGGE